MYIIVFVTAKNKVEAKKISAGLLSNKLCACVNIIDKVDSFFFWQKKIDNAKETLLVIKSKKEKMPAIIKLVKSLHSYDVPEIIAMPIVFGYTPYLRWIDESLR